MARDLKISIGQHSDKGRKESNQDFHGAMMPPQPALGSKGVAVALADGISSSSVSRVASESAVKGFLTDYYCTSDAWSVKTSAQRVIDATNSWLHSQTRRSHVEDADRGYVCTLNVVVLKGRTAHIFHIGDSRVYRVAGNAMEQLTDDHRVVLSSEQIYLGRALGMSPQVEIDYRPIQLEEGDLFLQATDGVCEHLDARVVADAIAANENDLDGAAKAIVAEAYRRGSPDNLTVQLVRVDALPEGDAGESLGIGADLPLPPLLEPRQLFDGYRIVRTIHGSSRSHAYLAVDGESNETVVLKIPSIDLQGRPGQPEAVHDGGVDRAAPQQRPCAAAPAAYAEAQLPLCRHRVRRGPDAAAMDDRQSPGRTSRRCGASSSRSRAGCGPSIAWRCCTRTCGPRTS